MKITLPPLRQWMPFAIAALCVGLVVMAFAVLLSDHFEPESPQSALVTSPSAHGFMGLRRVLEARGYQTVLNRYDEKDKAETGDIAIITLDATSWSSVLEPISEPDSDTDEDEKKGDADDSSSSQASSSTPEPTVKLRAAPRRIDNGYEWMHPNYDRVERIHYQPRGRVVLLVAPKWAATPTRKNVRWAADPQLVWPASVANMSSLATTMKYTPASSMQLSRERAAANKEKFDEAAAKDVEWWAYQGPDEIVVTRNSEWREDQNVSGALAGRTDADYEEDEEDENKVRDDGRREFPLTQPVTLTPAPGQSTFTSGLTFGSVAGLQGITSPNLIPVLLGPKGEVLLSRVTFSEADGVPSKAVVYLLADPDILNNQTLADPQKLATAITLIDVLTPKPTGGQKPRVVFDLTFNGMAFDRSIIHYLSRPPYIALPLGLLILSLALMWAAFSRFGPPLETAKSAPMGRGVRVLADNAARLVGMAMRETRMGALYAQMVRDHVLKAKGVAMFGPQTLTSDELAERLGTLYGAKDSYLKLKADAQKPLSVHHLVDTARKLRAWKRDILHKSNS